MPPVGEADRPKLKPTRISGTWVAVLASIVVLIVLLVFILQNLAGATIHFFGAEGTLPLGVALLFAAIAGAIVVALVGAARIMQLRRQAKRGLR
ncbi:lipopolysaccharide assembly LapA domain-containing protein [Saccharothrix sp. HUAS TT1]|uniref:LapA family protein n=1 Tax=Saccharothrix sp. HUAS TT1 TaxID=3231910 RepID=UPI00345C27EB